MIEHVCMYVCMYVYVRQIVSGRQVNKVTGCGVDVRGWGPACVRLLSLYVVLPRLLSTRDHSEALHIDDKVAE
jgi:hypothetical protein